MTDQEKLARYDQFAGVLETLEARLHEVAPAWCCDHDDGPCLGCALEWLVENLSAPRAYAQPVRAEEQECCNG